MVRRRHSPRRTQASDTTESASPLYDFIEPTLLVQVCTHPYAASTAEEPIYGKIKVPLVKGLCRKPVMCLRVSAPLEPVSLLCAVDGESEVRTRERQTKQHKLHEEPRPTAALPLSRHAACRLAGLRRG